MLAPVRVTAPAASPLSLDEVKAHCRVLHSDDDQLLDSLIAAAVSHVDGYSGILGRALISQTWNVQFCRFENRLSIPFGPMISVTSVEYYDGANVLQTLAASVYAALSDGLGPYVAPKYNQQWPQTYTRDDAVRVTWVAGYGTAAGAVPMAIRQALLLLIGHWYLSREASVIGATVAELPFAVKALLEPFRRVGT